MHAQIKYRIRVKVIDRKRKREEERKRREKVQRSQYVHKYRLVFAECYFSSGCHLPASSFIAYRSPLTTHHSSFTGSLLGIHTNYLLNRLHVKRCIYIAIATYPVCIEQFHLAFVIFFVTKHADYRQVIQIFHCKSMNQ